MEVWLKVPGIWKSCGTFKMCQNTPTKVLELFVGRKSLKNFLAGQKRSQIKKITCLCTSYLLARAKYIYLKKNVFGGSNGCKGHLGHKNGPILHRSSIHTPFFNMETV